MSVNPSLTNLAIVPKSISVVLGLISAENETNAGVFDCCSSGSCTACCVLMVAQNHIAFTLGFKNGPQPASLKPSKRLSLQI
jgi:hypothetical protein